MNRRPREDVLVRRTVMVEAIPSGAPIELQAGQLAQITQALGGSFTLLVEGQLAQRLFGIDRGFENDGPEFAGADVMRAAVSAQQTACGQHLESPEVDFLVAAEGITHGFLAPGE